MHGVLHHHGHPNVRRLSHTFSKESWRRDANDLEGSPMNLNRFVENGGIQTETLLPEGIADHCHWRTTPRAVHFAGKNPAGRGFHTERCEIAPTDKFDASQLLLARAACEITKCHLEPRQSAVRGKHSGKNVVVIAQIFKLRVRQQGTTSSLTPKIRAVFVRVRQQHQLLRMLHVKGAKKYGFEDAEDSGVCPNSQGQSEHGYGGEARRFLQHARAKS